MHTHNMNLYLLRYLDELSACITLALAPCQWAAQGSFKTVLVIAGPNQS